MDENPIVGLVIVFTDVDEVPNNMSEFHVFCNQEDGLRFSFQNLHRKHLVKAIRRNEWHQLKGT